MKTDEIQIRERTNQRDGSAFVLEYHGATPLCPHCGHEMAKVGNLFENSACACWWIGSDDANYHAQVVVAATPEEEFRFRTLLTDRHAAEKSAREDERMKARLAYTVADDTTKSQIIQNLRYLHGREKRKVRARVREVIARGGDFDEALNQP